MKNAVFHHLQTLSFSYYNTHNVGYIHARLMSDTDKIATAFTWRIMDLVWYGSYILFVFVVMFLIDVKLALALFILVPVALILISLFQRKLIVWNRRVREQNALITGNFNEGITGAKTIKSLVIEDRIDEDFRAETTNMYNKARQLARHRSLFASVTDLAASFALAFVLWKGGILAKEQVGTFSMFMSYAQGLMEPVRWLVETLALFVNGKVNIERYTKLMETVPSVSDTPEVIEKYGADALRFNLITGFGHFIRCNNIVGCGENRHMRKHRIHFAGHLVELGDPVDLIPEKFHAVDDLVILRRCDLERIAVYAEGTAV